MFPAKHAPVIIPTVVEYSNFKRLLMTWEITSLLSAVKITVVMSWQLITTVIYNGYELGTHNDRYAYNGYELGTHNDRYDHNGYLYEMSRHLISKSLTLTSVHSIWADSSYRSVRKLYVLLDGTVVIFVLDPTVVMVQRLPYEQTTNWCQDDRIYSTGTVHSVPQVRTAPNAYRRATKKSQ